MQLLIDSPIHPAHPALFTFSSKRSTIVYSLAVASGFFYIPVLGIWLVGRSQTGMSKLEWFAEYCFSLIAPGLPYVMNGLVAVSADPDSHPFLINLSATLQGGVMTVIGFIYVSVWHSILYQGNVAFVPRAAIVVSLAFLGLQQVGLERPPPPFGGTRPKPSRAQPPRLNTVASEVCHCPNGTCTVS